MCHICFLRLPVERTELGVHFTGLMTSNVVKKFLRIHYFGSHLVSLYSKNIKLRARTINYLIEELA